MKNIRSDKTVRLCRKARVIKRLTIILAILVLIGGVKSTLNLQNVNAKASPKAMPLVKEIIDEVRNAVDSIPTCTEESIKRENDFLRVVEKRYNQNIVEPAEEEVIEETYYEDSYVDEDYTNEPYEEYYEEETYEEEYVETYSTTYSPEYLMNMGVVYDGGFRYTWYSERVLPGGGLNIPGRWSDGNFVRDGEGYICVASEDFAKGTVLETPWGTAKVYDCGCAHGTIDVYTSWD